MERAVSITSLAILCMTSLLSRCSANVSDESNSGSDQADRLGPTISASASAENDRDDRAERSQPNR